jgi:hypothetical protein
MTKERLIWRPNEISPEEWDALSREEQIQWWKDLEASRPKRAKPHMIHAVDVYNRGDITKTEFGNYVCRLAIRDEMEEFIRLCPPDLMAEIKRMLANHPGDDQTKWPRTFYIACYAPWVTAEQIEESKRKEQEQTWNGIRILKEFIHVDA